MAETDRSKLFFWPILIYGTMKSVFVCESYGCFTNGLRIRWQNGPKVGKKLRRWLEIDENGGEKYTNWTLTRPNQQQDPDYDTNSTLRTLKLKYAEAMARKDCRTGKRYDTRFMGRTQEHSKVRVDVNLTVYLKLITTWWEQGWPDLSKCSRNSRFSGDETQIDPASEQHDPKRCIFLFFWKFSFI